MTFVENKSINMNGNSKMKDIIDMAEDGPDALLIDEEDCTKLASNLESILLLKCEEQGDAFLKVKRADNGLAAWHEVHKWYVATSGVRINREDVRLHESQASEER